MELQNTTVPVKQFTLAPGEWAIVRTGGGAFVKISAPGTTTTMPASCTVEVVSEAVAQQAQADALEARRNPQQ